jgi:hypothetical protein
MTFDVSSTAEAAAYAVKDLAARLGVAASSIIVAEAAEAMWPDTSLGMPEPGRMYAQMLTEGFRVVLEAAGKKFEYRFGGGRVRSMPSAFDD